MAFPSIPTTLSILTLLNLAAVQGCAARAAGAAPVGAAAPIVGAIVVAAVLADLEYSSSPPPPSAATETRTDDGQFEDARPYVDDSGEVQRLRRRRATATPRPMASDVDDVELRDTSELLATPKPQALKTGDLPETVSPGALQAALRSVDLSMCGAPLGRAGAPRGYGHARVTFEPTGRVSRVTIEGPTSMEPAAVICMGDRLATARVEPFTGKPITAGRTWYTR